MKTSKKILRKRYCPVCNREIMLIKKTPFLRRHGHGEVCPGSWEIGLDAPASKAGKEIALAWKVCANYGKHFGTGHYHICRRCKAGEFPQGCGDFTPRQPDSLYVTNPDGTVELVDDMGEVK